jgi:flagellar M-ring protein FliF
MPGPSANAPLDLDNDMPLGDGPPPLDLDSLPDFPQVALPAMGGPFGPGDTIDIDPVTRLKRLIEEREEETVDILRSWMDEDEEGQLR